MAILSSQFWAACHDTLTQRHAPTYDTGDFHCRWPSCNLPVSGRAALPVQPAGAPIPARWQGCHRRVERIEIVQRELRLQSLKDHIPGLRPLNGVRGVADCARSCRLLRTGAAPAMVAVTARTRSCRCAMMSVFSEPGWGGIGLSRVTGRQRLQNDRAFVFHTAETPIVASAQHCVEVHGFKDGQHGQTVSRQASLRIACCLKSVGRVWFMAISVSPNAMVGCLISLPSTGAEPVGRARYFRINPVSPWSFTTWAPKAMTRATTRISICEADWHLCAISCLYSCASAGWRRRNGVPPTGQPMWVSRGQVSGRCSPPAERRVPRPAAR